MGQQRVGSKQHCEKSLGHSETGQHMPYRKADK